MGLTQKLGTIPLAIFTDASNNIGIGGSPSGSYKLEVTGTSNFTGVLKVSAATGFSVGSLSGYRRIEYSGTTFSLLTNADGFAGLSAGAATLNGNLEFASGYFINMPWASDTRTMWERYTNSTYFQRISSNGTLRQLRIESNGAYGNASIVLDGQSNDTTTVIVTSDTTYVTGKFGIGLAAPSAPLEIIAGSATGTTTAIILTRALGYGSSQLKTYYNSGSDWGLIINTATESGGVKLVKDATSWAANTSDERKKKNFEPSQGLEELMKIEALKYHFEWDDDSIPKRMGFKAQNLLPLIPEMVLTTGDKAPDGSDYLTIIPDYLLPVLVKSIQELNDRLTKAGL